jgi:hypothetical protein
VPFTGVEAACGAQVAVEEAGQGAIGAVSEGVPVGLGMFLANQRKRFCKETVPIVDGTLVPTREHTVAEQSRNYRYSTNHQVVIDADTRLVVAVGRPLPGNRNDCKAWELSGARPLSGRPLSSPTVDTGAQARSSRTAASAARTNFPLGRRGTTPPTAKSKARVEHVFARMKTWKILRDRRLKGDGVHHAPGETCLVRPALSARLCHPGFVIPPKGVRRGDTLRWLIRQPSAVRTTVSS